VENLRAMQREVDCTGCRLERQELADQRAAELSRQRALLADLVLWELFVLSLARFAEVRRSVREHHLLTQQQGESQQDLNQGTLSSHQTFILVQSASAGFRARSLPRTKGISKLSPSTLRIAGRKRVRQRREGARIRAALRSDQEEARWS